MRKWPTIAIPSALGSEKGDKTFDADAGLRIDFENSSDKVYFVVGSGNPSDAISEHWLPLLTCKSAPWRPVRRSTHSSKTNGWQRAHLKTLLNHELLAGASLDS